MYNDHCKCTLGTARPRIINSAVSITKRTVLFIIIDEAITTLILSKGQGKENKKEKIYRLSVVIQV